MTAHPCCGCESDSTDVVVSAERTVARPVARQRIATLSHTAAALRCVPSGGKMVEGSWVLLTGRAAGRQLATTSEARPTRRTVNLVSIGACLSHLYGTGSPSM